jgi:YD repeat-containing protein
LTKNQILPQCVIMPPLSPAQIEDDLGEYFERKQAGDPVPHEFVVPFASGKRELSEPHSQRPRSFEALAGGHWPGHGYVGAYQMLKAVDAIGRPADLDFAVLDGACREVRASRDRSGRTKRDETTRFTWNASGRLIGRDDFVARFMDTLDLHDIDPSRVGVEVLEDPALVLSEVVIARIALLTVLQTQIHIDDLFEGESYQNTVALERAHELNLPSMPADRKVPYNGLKFGQTVREGIVNGDALTRRMLRRRIFHLLAEADTTDKVLTFERGGDTETEWVKTQEAIKRLLPAGVRDGHVVLIQGGPRIPVSQLLS